jgi:LPXTG-site transpeptidase (sortase) family protein
MKNPLKSGLNSLFTPKETSFIVWFMVIFIASAGLLSLFGLLPSELTEQSDGQTLSEKVAGTAAGAITGTNPGNAGNNNDDIWSTGNSGQVRPNTTNSSNTASSNTSKNLTQNGLPTRLIIPSIKVDTQVYIPRNTTTSVLDADLTKGPVYYPGSGTINTGNMFIFGHSTGYSVVINKAYKVFNELKNLTPGQMIYIESEGKQFSYKVRTVDKVDKDETLVTFDTKAHLLTLSTCNSFGAKSDRYVVVAEFVGEVS